MDELHGVVCCIGGVFNLSADFVVVLQAYLSERSGANLLAHFTVLLLGKGNIKCTI